MSRPTTNDRYTLSQLQVSTPLYVLVGLLVLLGVGAGLFTSPMSSAILGSAARERRGVASAILSTARGLGMVLGFSLGGSVFSTVLGGSSIGPSAEQVTQAADTTLLVAAGLATLAAIVLSIRHSFRSTTLSPSAGDADRHEVRLPHLVPTT